MTTGQVVTKSGIAITLGRSLGRGGEGEVFDVSGQAHSVAKLYLQPPDFNKQQKLALMAEQATPELLKHATWPQQVLYRGSVVVGFLMPKLSGYWPIHELYGPQSRMKHFPGQTWDFLLLAARNTAAAFVSLHQHGHVVGDVNQSNLMVNGQAQVRLIDCDSFQVTSRDRAFICEVGVGHFTPPELQNIKSFSNVRRSPNHDSFGLALLIFHLLFGGKHPYSGVAQRKDIGDTLEMKISRFCFAYASDCSKRGILPPPNALGLSLVPQPVSLMFERAFTESGVSLRPRPDEWLTALDLLRKNISRCPNSYAHVYSSHLASCPWCTLEAKGVVYFLPSQAPGNFPTQQTGSFSPNFDINQIVTRVAVLQIPNLSIGTVVAATQATPIPEKVITANSKRNPVKIIIYLIILFLFFSAPAYWLFYIAAIVGINIATSHSGNQALEEEKKARQKQLSEAQMKYDSYLTYFRQNILQVDFLSSKRYLEDQIRQYQDLPNEERRQLDALQQNLRIAQLLTHLQQFNLEYAEIPLVGPSRKSDLRSFGIQTAADVSEQSVRAVPGFGEKITGNVMAWRLECERKFTFNPHAGVSATDRNAVSMKYAAKRKTIEIELRTGLKKLEDQINTVNGQLASLRPGLAQRATELAKAKADFNEVIAFARKI